MYFQLEELCETSSDHEIIEALEQLPVGMTETYARILRRISSSPRRSLLASKALKWIVCAKRPLKITELAEAIAFSPEDKQWDPNKIPDALQVLRSCGNLVTFDEQDQSVRLVHHTVQQHLLSDTSEDALKHLHFNEAEGNIHAGKICITYLLFSDFETQLVNMPPELDIIRVQEALISEMPHALDLGTLFITAWKTFRKLKGSTRTPNINASAMFPKRNPPSCTLQQKYLFLDYTINHWTSHTISFTPVLDLWDKFKDVALYKASTFDIRPWGSSQLAGELPHMLLFRWAVHNGHMALLEVLKYLPHGREISTYFHHEADQGRSPTLIAVENGHDHLLTFLWGYDYLSACLHRQLQPQLSTEDIYYANQLLLVSVAQHNVQVAQWVANFLYVCLSEEVIIEATIVAMSNTTEGIGNFYSRWILHFFEIRGRNLKSALNEHNFGPLLDVSIEKGHLDVVRFLLQKAEEEEVKNNMAYRIFDVFCSRNSLRFRESDRPDMNRVLLDYFSTSKRSHYRIGDVLYRGYASLD